MSGRLLVVDDDPDVLDALELLLGDVYEVTAVEDGDDALEWLRRDHFDCVVLDLMMPRLSGTGVLARMHEEHLIAPVILASAAMDIAEQAQLFGAADYIAKPYDVEVLEQKIARLIGGGGDSGPHRSSRPSPPMKQRSTDRLSSFRGSPATH